MPVSQWELAAESISLKIRWFGVVLGYVLVQTGPAEHRGVLNAILALGALYALVDTLAMLRGHVFLGRFPLAVSVMEALFIGLLCGFHGGLDSFFRFYYILSLICASIRYAPSLTTTTWFLHSASYAILFAISPPTARQPAMLILMIVVMGWVAWASTALASLLKRMSIHLDRLNEALRDHQMQLEERIADRTHELRETQAHLLHQEKMAAFGLLAAGIAHEVGNPLTAISSLIQMLQRKNSDEDGKKKLELVGGQLQRIQKTLRELISFSRPASNERTWVTPREVFDDALGIAKYYQRTKNREIQVHIAEDAPPVWTARDPLVQAVLNLLLNAVDATTKGGCVSLRAERQDGELMLSVRDNGTGIDPAHVERVFQPYFTTKERGTGLGLFVTRKLVADQGGTIEFRTPEEGGTEFVLRLPLEREAAVC